MEESESQLSGLWMGAGEVKRRALFMVGILQAIPYSSNNRKESKSYLKRVRTRKLKKI